WRTARRPVRCAGRQRSRHPPRLLDAQYRSEMLHMGTLTFQLPAGLPKEAARELERACLAGGPDNMPSPTELRHIGDQLLMSRPTDESGYLVAPWVVDGQGVLASTSATLMERKAPYDLLIELARGKLNQVRSQASDWKVGGLQIPPMLADLIHEASRTFGW